MDIQIHTGQPLAQRVRRNKNLPIESIKVDEGFDFDEKWVKQVQSMASYRKKSQGKVFTVGRFEFPDGRVVGRCTRVL